MLHFYTQSAKIFLKIKNSSKDPMKGQISKDFSKQNVQNGNSIQLHIYLNKKIALISQKLTSISRNGLRR